MLPTSVPRRDPVLTAAALEFKNADFVGDSLGPVLEVETRTFEYGALDKLNLFQNIDDTLATYGEANEVGFGAEIASATMQNHGLRTTIAREDVEDSEDRFLSLASDKQKVLSATLALSREVRQKSKVVAALTAAGRTSSGGNWGDYTATAVDIPSMVREKSQSSLYAMESAICPKQILFKLERHPSLLSLYFDGNSGKKILTKDQIAELLGLKELIVPDGRYTTTKRPGKVALGTPIDGSLNRIWGNSFILFRRANGLPNRMEPGFFYQWRRRWTKDLKGDNMRVRTWELPHVGMGGAYVIQQEYQSLDMLFPEMGWEFTVTLS
jgi:predicted RNase H-related nuclease YkuK (DUF458 family)